MRIAIVGAGIVGAATAYELAADGHEVTVLSSAARRRGGQLCQRRAAGAGAAHALGATGHGRWHLRQLWGSRHALRLVRGAGPSGLAWLWRWAQAGRSPTAGGCCRPQQLGQYSLARTRSPAEQLEVDIETSRGALVLLRRPECLQRLQPALQLLREAGSTITDIDADTARLIEPGLSADTPLAGALHAPDGEAGNCRLFALVLRQAAQNLGAQFMFGSAVRALTHAPRACRSPARAPPALRRRGAVRGPGQRRPAAPAGPRLPLRALYGYTISAPLREDTHARRRAP